MRTSSNSNSKTNSGSKSCLSNKTYQQEEEEEEDGGGEVDLGLKPLNQDPSFVSNHNDDDDDDTNGGAHLYYYKMTDSSSISSSSSSRVYDMTCTTVTADSTPSLLGLGLGVRPFNLQPFHVSHSSFFSSGSGMARSGVGVGFQFTAAQWKELERQAMIYKYMVASLPVPPNLLYSCFPSNPTSYWLGKYGSEFDFKWVGNSKDAEPGRCRRTDGKKWRCSRDVAPNKKYCERHMHRGRPCSRKPVEQLQQTHSLPDFAITKSSNINDGIIKNNPTKKTRFNHLNSSLSVGSCFPSVLTAKNSAFFHPLASGATPFEDSRNMFWTEEQQWQQLVQANMNSQVYQHQFESDAWSTEVTGIKDNSESNKPCLASSNVNHDEVCQMHMGQGVLGRWAGNSPSFGGPLAEVLRPNSVSNNPVTSNAGEGDFITTLTGTFSDSSGSSSPTGHNSKVKSDMPFNWLN